MSLFVFALPARPAAHRSGRGEGLSRRANGAQGSRVQVAIRCDVKV